MKNWPSPPKSGSSPQPSTALGSRVAQLLAGAWKGLAASPAVSPQEVEELAPLLLSLGAGGLAWCRIRQGASPECPGAQQLRQAYRFQALEMALHERRLQQVIPHLRSVGVEPVLVKGWAISRLYPEPGMRPFGDLDLCVLPEQYRAARAALASPQWQAANIDLHEGFGKFCDRRADDIFAHSRQVELDGLEVRVLSEEDHLHFLCMHLLRHGAIRPLWLCDLAVLLERRAAFDWARCLTDSPRRADRVACAIGLAHQLVGAEVDGTPVADRARRLPKWMVPAVLREWGSPPPVRAQVEIYLRHPLKLWRGLPGELPRHWPNPIEATMTVQGPFNELPRLPFQVGHICSRALALMAAMAGKALKPVRPEC